MKVSFPQKTGQVAKLGFPNARGPNARGQVYTLNLRNFNVRGQVFTVRPFGKLRAHHRR